MSPRIVLMYSVWLHREQGQSLRSISRTLGISRKTVRKLLRELHKRRAQGDDVLERSLPKESTPRGSKLDPYENFIAQKLRRYPNIRATRLHEDLQLQGFEGGYTIVREHLNQLRPKVERTEPDVLVITPPGKQAQADWSPYTLPDGTRINCFVCVLGHSRFIYAYFTLDMRQPTIFRQLTRAFETFGGIPHECVFDTMPGIIDRWEHDQPIFNLMAIDYAVYNGFELHAAPRYYAKYKGKVERPNRFMDDSFFNGRTFYTIEQANETLRWWLDNRANSRVHRMTKRVPAEVLLEERSALNPLPQHPYDDRELALRLVDSYGYVDFDGNHYRAPVQIGSWIYVRASETEVAVVAGPAKVVAVHPRAPRNANLYVPPPQQHRRKRPTSELMQCLEAWGPVAKRFGTGIRERKRYWGAELEHVIGLQRTYSLQDILAAIEHANRYGAYGVRELERILQTRFVPRTFEDHLAAAAREHIRRAMDHSPVQQRDLSAYAQLLGSAADEEPDDDDADDDDET